MKVLLLGGGGREHALAWALSRSVKCDALFAMPGSDAIGQIARLLSGKPEDPETVISACKKHSIDFVVCGPEGPLAAGVGDKLREAGIPFFGPNQEAAQLESSKTFAKEFLQRHNIPTAHSVTITSMDEVADALNSFAHGVVVKADGLAGGKGVAVCDDHDQAEAAIRECLESKRFGSAGTKVLLEERLSGPEVSYMGLCDGSTFLALPSSSDHKRLGDGDSGPNTGGMGVIAPSPHFTAQMRERVDREIIAPTLAGLTADELPFSGMLYCGLMLTPEGPKVLEFNVRLGDPETQAVLPLCDVDWLEILWATATGDLRGKKLPSRGAAVCVVLAAAGYPTAPKSGAIISGIDTPMPEGLVFHAGTRQNDGQWQTAGGRVLSIVGLGDDLQQARQSSYSAAQRIHFSGLQMRSDIGAVRETSAKGA
jgi:phosphoribosylamine--glycine ligase